MYSIGDYGDMIADKVRMDPYAFALKAAIGPDSVVLDIGTGTGMHALLACKFGARKVYAVEPNDAIHLARELARENCYPDHIEFFQDVSTHITLPEKADVIVSDLRGVLPLYGGPLFWGLFTALLSGLIGKRTDIGIDNQFIKEVGDSLEPGDSALFLLVVDVTPDKVMPELVKFGSTVYQTSLSKEAEANFQKALENEHVNEAVGDMLDLEDELERLVKLKDEGIITEEEFEAKKKEMLDI